MCGICGFTRACETEGDRATLKAMCDVMAHRGPDGEGLYLADGIALGHRRLSLVDLEGGGQPMVRSTGAHEAQVMTPAVAFHHVRGQAAATSADTGPAASGEMVRGQWSIVFNGEIYNYRELRDELVGLGYRFETDSDTEVLLVGYIVWSEAVLQRVRGMFAFAVYDAASRELFCARDFFGIKPLYYTVQDGQFIFASEIKCLLEHPAYERELNEEALAQYLCFQFSALHETFFKGVYKLSPGHFLRVRHGGAVQMQRYWAPEYARDETLAQSGAVDQIERVLRESVRYHNVADVEVGSFLSSGIDSSYLAALLACENPDIKTFTVGFAEYEGERDEVSWARELAGQLQVENDFKHIGEDEFWSVLPLVQWHMDEPSADPSAVALYFVDQIAARRVKAVLSGEGADELFGGYRIYQTPIANAHVGMLPKPWLRAGAKALRTAHLRGANYLERASETVEEWYYTNANGVAFSVDERRNVLAADVLERVARSCNDAGDVWRAIGLGEGRAAVADARCSGGAAARGETTPHGEGARAAAPPGTHNRIATPQELTAPVYAEVCDLDETARMQHVDMWFWLVGDILLKTDKMSMAHSLESRVPFLDREVFRVAARTPTSLNVSETQTKCALREAAERAVPRDWAQKEKLGFPVPIAGWLRDERYSARIRDAFASEEAKAYFDVGELMRLLDDHLSGAVDNARRIWIVYSFLIWYRVYFVERVKPE